MVRLAGVEVVVLEDVQEGEETAVDPSPSLLHQILVALHRVCPGPSVGNVPEIELGLGLAVDPQGQDSVFSQIHVGFLIAAES